MDSQKPTQPDSGMNFAKADPLDKKRDAIGAGLPPAEPDNAAGAEEAAADAELDAGSWFKQNWLMLVVVLIAAIFLYRSFGLTGMVSIGKVALGLSLVIFVHELGHYLAAKWCGVYVQVFSIGFGPAVPGCHFKWGETYYKLAIFPFGGYVQMLGQVDGHEENDGTEDDPRSYKNKTVLQRMLIISAGVIMNAILAVICFVVVFQGPGKERRASTVAISDSGSPAARIGIPSGAVIDAVGDIEDPNFKDLTIAVISHYNTELKVVYHRPGDSEKTTVSFVPRKNSNDDRPLMGISPSFIPVLEEKRFIGGDVSGPFYPGSAASKAQPPFEFEDQIVATTDPATGKITELPEDPRKPGGGQRDYFELVRRMQLLAGNEMVFQVLRKEHGQTKTINITVPPEYHHTLGAVMTMGEVVMVRKKSPAEVAGVQEARLGKGKGNKELDGDYIKEVRVTEADGNETVYTADVEKAKAANAEKKKVQVEQLDPLRLPYQLRQWAKSLAKKGVDPKEWKVTLVVKRQNPPKAGGGNEEFETKELKLDWDNSWDFDRVEPYSKDSPQAIPELGLGYQVNAIVAAVEPGSAPGGDEGLRPKDVIKEIQYSLLKDDQGNIETSKWKPIEQNQWAHAFWVLQSPGIVKVSLKVNRDDKEDVVVTLEPQKAKNWPATQRGLLLAQDKRLQKATDFFDAVGLGLRDTYNTVLELFTGLRSMATGGVSVEKSLGGPVMIATFAYQYASIDFWEFVFFIGMISINLAVINFLPIPVLDGGHMVFLLYELVRGKPASENIRVGATYAGLLFILCLFVFVLYLDISRLFFTG